LDLAGVDRPGDLVRGKTEGVDRSVSYGEVVILAVVAVCATVAAVTNALSSDALSAVFGGIIGWGGKGIAVAKVGESK
jgi:hypothetical protein